MKIPKRSRKKLSREKAQKPGNPACWDMPKEKIVDPEPSWKKYFLKNHGRAGRFIFMLLQ
jgi:hypothetical protein